MKKFFRKDLVLPLNSQEIKWVIWENCCVWDPQQENPGLTPCSTVKGDDLPAGSELCNTDFEWDSYQDLSPKSWIKLDRPK